VPGTQARKNNSTFLNTTYSQVSWRRWEIYCHLGMHLESPISSWQGWTRIHYYTSIFSCTSSPFPLEKNYQYEIFNILFYENKRNIIRSSWTCVFVSFENSLVQAYVFGLRQANEKELEELYVKCNFYSLVSHNTSLHAYMVLMGLKRMRFLD
jgi:hypothetical protein